ncbi:MAG: GNAT family N-acetyltransferase [Marinomonas colpomeniae]
MLIRQADKTHIPDIARLFDLYRQFYECEPDIELATKYISERINQNESIIFFSESDGKYLGFVQMYPSFCSVEAVSIFILYDLYVDGSARDLGVGTLLMEKAREYAKVQGASRIDLMTAFSNKAGQHLYEKLGYKKVNENFHNYSLPI